MVTRGKNCGITRFVLQCIFLGCAPPTFCVQISISLYHLGLSFDHDVFVFSPNLVGWLIIGCDCALEFCYVLEDFLCHLLDVFGAVINDAGH